MYFDAFCILANVQTREVVERTSLTLRNSKREIIKNNRIVTVK